MLKNLQIRDLARCKNVPLWKIAERLNLSDSYFSRKLRHEFSDSERERIIVIIHELAAESE